MRKNLQNYFGVVDKSTANANLAIGVLGGALIGVVAGLLFAPKAGVELRKDIADVAETGLNKAGEYASKAGVVVKEKGEVLYGKIKETASKLKKSESKLEDFEIINDEDLEELVEAE